MADVSKIFKPRRGTKSIMAGTKKSIVLASGELFVEVPDAGVGKGASKIKIGDGTTAYSRLPYALGDTSNDKISFSSNTSTTVAAALNSVTSGGSLKNIVAGLKQAVSLCNKSITKLNDDFASFNSAKSSIISSALGKALSMTTTTTIADVATKIKSVTNRGAWTSKPTTIGKVTIPKGYHNGSGYVDTSNFSNDNSSLILGITDITNTKNIRRGYIIYGAITTGKEYDLSKYKYIQLIFQQYNYYDETWGVGFTKKPNDTLVNCQNASTKQTYSHAGNSQDSFITKSIYLDISGINEKGYPFVYRVGSVYSYVLKLQLVNELEVL